LTTIAHMSIVTAVESNIWRNTDMAGNVSKNARREGTRAMMSRWGGPIKMRSVFENGKLRHMAYCEKSGNTARKPKDLM